MLGFFSGAGVYILMHLYLIFHHEFLGLRLSDGPVGNVTAGTFLWISGEQLIKD
jgi:hypothetical protein